MGGMATGENSNGSGATYGSLKNRKIDKVSMDGTSGNLNFSKPQNLLTQKIDMDETIENTVSTPLNGSGDFSNISQNNYKNKKNTKLDFSSMYTSDEDATAFSDELHSTDSDLDIQNKTYGEMKAQERKAQQDEELKARKTQQRIEDKALAEKQKLEMQQVRQQVQKSRQSQIHPTVSAEAQRENESLANHLVNETSEMSGLNSLYEKMYQDNPVEAEANLQNLIQLTSHKDQQTGQKLARDMRSIRSNYSDFRVKEQTANYKDDIPTSNNSSNHSIPENTNKLENTHTFIFTDDRAQILSQTDERIDPIGFYNEVKFDPSGMGRNSYALFNLIDAQKISTTADEAEKITNELYNGNSHNNEGDAFRHALWSYLSTLEVGYEEAKNFLDAHEITSTNSDNERMMDLFNNEIGRRLALDPRNKERNLVEVITEAYVTHNPF